MSKNKKYISLKSENDEEVDKIISNYNEIIKIINQSNIPGNTSLLYQKLE
jgi:hypothetical protein